MTNVEQEFATELEIFRTEAEAAAQFFYGYLAMHEVAKRDKSVFLMFNQNALFWNTILGGLQAAALMAIGRIFDQGSPHNVDTVLRLAQLNNAVFSKMALGARKQGSARQPPSWLAQFLHSAYEPKPTDFRRLRAYIKRYRRIYESKYRNVRHEFYAHKVAANQTEISALFANTNIREMQRLFTFLLRLHQALWELFNNGMKPLLRPFRHSAHRIGRLPSPSVSGDSVHEEIIVQAKRALFETVMKKDRRHGKTT